MKSKHCSRIHLSEIPVLEVSKMRFKAVGSVRPLNESCDFVYFSIIKKDDYIPWKLAFDHHNVSVYEWQKDSDALESNNVRDLALLSGGLRESAVWLNDIVKRFMMNGDFSETVINDVREKMASSWRETLEEKDQKSTIENLKIAKLNIASEIDLKQS